MNSRERMLAVTGHEVPDRTPTEGWFHGETIKNLLKHYKTDDWQEVLDDLGVEQHAGLVPRLAFPEYEKKKIARPGGRPGQEAVWLDERTHENAWGVQHRLGDGDWYEQWLTGPLVDATGPDDVAACQYLPTVEQIADPENYADRVKQLKAEGRWVTGGIPNPYKQAWMMRGMDNLLVDYLINRDFLDALYDRLYEVFGEMCKRMAAAGVDQISYTGDIAMQDRIIMGADTWRAVDKPRTAKLIADCKALNPDVRFFIHSDGNVTDLMDDLVEIGFDIINPIQPECMDPVEVKKRWGDRITLHGGISLQKTLPFGSVDEVREEVSHLIRTCGYNGGLVVFPSNVIQPDTPAENIVACFHTARDFDLAAL